MSNNSKKVGGYGKSSSSSRWKKGQSGNPKGRPKDDKSLHRISNEHLHEMIINAGLVSMDYMEKGQKKSATKLHIILTQLTTKAASGDMRATKLYIQLMTASTTVKDKARYEWLVSWAKLQSDILDVQNKKGTFEHYRIMRRYYMFKKDIRSIEGGDRWPYEPEEPVTTEDWVLFINHYEALKQGATDLAPWPLDYPSNNMSKKELAYIAELELEELKNKKD